MKSGKCMLLAVVLASVVFSAHAQSVCNIFGQSHAAPDAFWRRLVAVTADRIAVKPTDGLQKIISGLAEQLLDKFI